MSDLIHNDRSFVSFELVLIKVVMYLLIFISDVNVVKLFINESGIIQKKLDRNLKLRSIDFDLFRICKRKNVQDAPNVLT